MFKTEKENLEISNMNDPTYTLMRKLKKKGTNRCN